MLFASAISTLFGGFDVRHKFHLLLEITCAAMYGANLRVYDTTKEAKLQHFF